MNKRALRIAIVAGEVSGDILGQGLVQQLKQQYPNAKFEGIGGPKMIAEGFNSFVPMERLAVMGISEVFGRLFELIKIRKNLVKYFTSNPPDVFIGIDAPDFNLGLEQKLKQAGIKTVHYVSPSVWAWRQKRIFKIVKSVDLMLTLFPFEEKFYQQHDLAVEFVGHPLADTLPLEPDSQHARKKLNISDDRTVVALLPGSRGTEVAMLGDLFLQAAKLCFSKNNSLQFVLACANEKRYQQIKAIQSIVAPDLPLILVTHDSHAVLEACDAVLIASGTAALEAMLLKKPMVVAYKMAKLSYAIMSRMLKAKYVSLPNLLADKLLVPEILQDAATPERLAEELTKQIANIDNSSSLKQSFLDIHKQIKKNASVQAAQAVSVLIEKQVLEK